MQIFNFFLDKICKLLTYNIPQYYQLSTRNTLDCDHSNYSLSTVFSYIPIEFGQTRNSAIRSADPKNPTVEPNIKWIG